MAKHCKTSLVHKEHTKGTENRLNQLVKAEKAFACKPATMLMIAHFSGIERADIYRYVATLRTEKIALLSKRSCQVSEAEASFRTDLNLFPTDLQLKTF